MLDVRPDAEAGREPFLRLLTAAERVTPGEAFVVIAPFELAAVYDTLAAQGFVYEAEHVGPGVWLTRFTRIHAPNAAASLSRREGDADD